MRLRHWLAVSAFFAVAVSSVQTVPSRTRPRPRKSWQFFLPGEFEAQRRLLISWDHSITDVFTSIVAAALGDVEVVVLVPEDEELRVRVALAEAGINASLVRFANVPVESIWIRDYGPLTVKRRDGAVRVLDGQYPYRDHDDAAPSILAPLLWGKRAGQIPMIVEGGNVLSNGRGVCIASDQAVANDSYQYPEHLVRYTFRRHLGCNRLIIVPSVPGEETGHVDMYVTLSGPRDAVVGSYTSTQDPVAARALDEGAERLRRAGFRVRRIPMPHFEGGIYRTYTNVIILNRTVLVPIYDDDQMYEARALHVLRQAFRGRHVLPVNATDLIELQGALHCIAMNVPR